ncbi:TrbI/VirB10 family protein [Sphingomonas oligoaromativorans]|uniref:TrbI/VirB10 family protein n=1 Tax=Sphingomonas oligoaromativorans TaxID=575322 RepID=UPI00313346E5|nr:type IV secretion system protein VirB10 [Sphingomonas oligoaromativorans]
MALRPHAHRAADQPTDLSQPASVGSPDTLNGLPTNYGSAPKLGPPLPGDLGKPVLEHQQAMLVAKAEPASNAALTRNVDELRAARQSPILVQNSGGRAPISPAQGTAITPQQETGTHTTVGSLTDASDQEKKIGFMKALEIGSAVNPHEPSLPVSPWLLSAGSVIPASLITGLRSDLPGLVTALITENVYDTPTGRALLIPQGSRLVGSYDSQVTFGQRRALLVWQRLLWPDGSSLALDNMPGTDVEGYAGLEDRIDHHDGMLLKGVVLSTLLGIGTEVQFTGRGGLTQAIRHSTQQSVSRTGDQLISKALDIQPTITVRPGTPVRLLVQRDLILRPWKEEIR